MSITKTDLEIIQGETFKYPVLVYEVADVEASPSETPSLMDLTGCDAHMQIRSAPGATILVDAKSGTGLDIDVSTSTITVDLTSDMTMALTSPRAEYDLWLLKADGNRVPILLGAVNVGMTITDPIGNP